MPDLPAIYARISSDRDADRLGVRRQIADCRALIQRRGWPSAALYVDDDVSAYRGKPRPEYRRLIADIAQRRVDAVVVWDLDRLHRHPRELEEFFEVCVAAGVHDLASVTGDVDLSTHEGQFLARILGAVAKKESDDKSRRIQRKALELAQAGKIGGGGSRPYGYRDDRRTIVPAEARVIREIAARLLAGDTLRSVTADLNRRRIRPVLADEWLPQTVRRMILAPRLSGQREHRGEILGKAEWPAILRPRQTADLRSLLTDPGRRTNRAARRYLLKGLLRCGHCGARMQGRPRADGARRYGCIRGPGQAGCGRTWILADTLEAFVAEAVLYRLDSPALAELLSGSHDDVTPDSLEADQRQLEELATAYAERAITLREWLTARAPIDRRIEAERKRRSRERRTSALDDFIDAPGTLRVRWPSLTLSRQHAIVGAVLDHLAVGPAVRGLNRFDSERLTPIWRI